MSEANLLAKCLSAPDLYPALEDALSQLIGHKLFTLMAIDWPRAEAARIYTNMPESYPVGGRKPLGAMTAWGKVVLEEARPWIGYTSDDIKGAFFDHQLIAKLGCASCLNMPVIDHDAAEGPRVIGTVNMLDTADHYQHAHIAIADPFANLLVQPYCDWAAQGA